MSKNYWYYVKLIIQVCSDAFIIHPVYCQGTVQAAEMNSDSLLDLDGLLR